MKIDDEQAAGEVGVICPYCGFTGATNVYMQASPERAEPDPPVVRVYTGNNRVNPCFFCGQHFTHSAWLNCCMRCAPEVPRDRRISSLEARIKADAGGEWSFAPRVSAEYEWGRPHPVEGNKSSLDGFPEMAGLLVIPWLFATLFAPLWFPIWLLFRLLSRPFRKPRPTLFGRIFVWSGGIATFTYALIFLIRR